MTFKLNGKVVPPYSSNVTLLSKIVPKIYPGEVFVFAGPGKDGIELLPGKIRRLFIKTTPITDDTTINTTTTTTRTTGLSPTAKTKTQIDTIVTTAVKNKRRKCISSPEEETKTENNPSVDDQEYDGLPSVDLFLNPNRANELDHIKKTTIERANDYFTSVDMGKVYPALFRLLWPSTLLCQKMISACSLAGTPRNCSLLFKRSN